MRNPNYGHIKIKLDELIKEQNISISKLAFRAEMQRTQLKSYIKGDIQRLDIDILSRLCYALDCSLDDILEYVPSPDKAD